MIDDYIENITNQILNYHYIFFYFSSWKYQFFFWFSFTDFSTTDESSKWSSRILSDSIRIIRYHSDLYSWFNQILLIIVAGWYFLHRRHIEAFSEIFELYMTLINIYRNRLVMIWSAFLIILPRIIDSIVKLKWMRLSHFYLELEGGYDLKILLWEYSIYREFIILI